MEPQLRSDQIDKPSEARVEKPQFQAPRSLDRVFAKARKRSSDQLERKKLRTLQLPVIKKFSVTERQGEPTPAALEALKQLSGKNRIVLGWQDLARDLLSRVGRPTDDESVAKLAHQLGPYFDQPFDQQEYAVQQDPEYAESLLNQAKQEFAALDVDEIVDHLDMIS